MDQDELEAFYASSYRIQRQETEDPIEKDLLMQQARADNTLTLVADDLALVRRHLDIGSSSGALLRAFKAQYGCTGIGIEPGGAYRDYSRAQGDQVFHSQEAVVEAGEQPFSLISMMHVLEHLPDPIAVLKQLRTDLLTPDGYLLLEVPNLYEHASFELAHLYAFSAKTLREVLRQAGYHVHWLKAHGSFRSPILKLYLTALAVPGAKSRPPRKRYIPGAAGVSLRRWLGTRKRDFFTRYWPDWTWQAPS
jgi:2-polyprenyl-3-methyl-5-hydroxy-6-metoxy-1,4-benzoquinol methylase